MPTPAPALAHPAKTAAMLLSAVHYLAAQPFEQDVLPLGIVATVHAIGELPPGNRLYQYPSAEVFVDFAHVKRTVLITIEAAGMDVRVNPHSGNPLNAFDPRMF